jgi:hypothetical protein
MKRNQSSPTFLKVQENLLKNTFFSKEIKIHTC